MDRYQAVPLNVEEAKANLREASFEISPQAWLLRNKWRLIGLAFVSGFVAGRLPVAAGVSMLRHASPLLVAALQQWREEKHKDHEP